VFNTGADGLFAGGGGLLIVARAAIVGGALGAMGRQPGFLEAACDECSLGDRWDRLSVVGG
jgi:hypothetical protein